MIDAMVKGATGLVVVLRIVAGVCLLASVILNCANIIGRYCFSVSISWAEEIMLFLMVGCVFCGLGVVAWSGRQIRMDVIVGFLPDTVRRALDFAAELLFIVTAGFVIAYAVPVVIQLYEFDQRSTAADFPLAIPQGMLPIGFGLAALLVAVRIIAFRAPRGMNGAPISKRRAAQLAAAGVPSGPPLGH